PVKRSITVSAVLGEKIASSTGCKQFLPVRIEGEVAYPIFKESGAINGSAKADGYIVIDENMDMIQQVHPVMITLF
ncbi:MAG: molybdopterin molybdenumtransferase MoeA, partial [Dehalococcoidia bacterium]